MKDFSYLLKRKIYNIDEVKSRLESRYFLCVNYRKIRKFGKAKKKRMPDQKMILNRVSTYFHKRIGYKKPPHIKIEDKKTCYIYGFILSKKKSILDNEDLRSKLHLYPSDFESSFRGLKGVSLIAYGFDKRVIDNFWIQEAICTLWSYLDDDEYGRLICDYVWLDCPSDMMNLFKDKFELKSLEHNPNLLYGLLPLKTWMFWVNEYKYI